MRIARFGHAAIKVRELAIAERFYREVLGFEVTARYPEDREIIFGFGGGDHLLVQAVGADAPVPDAKTLGIHHLAFVLADGERALGAARRELASHGIEYRDVDHGDHRSVYFHDPDGHVLELYHHPSDALPSVAVPARERIARARRYVFGHARLVDRFAFEAAFGDAPVRGAACTRLVAALEAYRNSDGGFGHALEPDLRSPESQPLHTETALAILKEAGVRRPDVARGCCDFLARIAAPDAALPAFLPGALDYPAAAHWQRGTGAVPSRDRTCGMVALLAWHGAQHPWFDHARASCLEHLERAEIDEAHHLRYAFQLASTLPAGSGRDRLLGNLRARLDGAAYYAAEIPVTTYGLTPLHFAERPDAPARTFFDDASIERHLDDLAASQLADGGWPIRFTPPSAAAVHEWRGRWTVEALHALLAYGRLP